ncbi:hypothetical protein Pan216_06990 [Planctomycetes bacterium Pan216]|uniref:Sialate O-acetylesterase domain-containing protein n=1 Tax=Kolteria novifilia TaxID=2527975 RepID=A0A518AYR1_9BACT|nr:hypothetical protein Pan216_06990 [Planctomycetes bacterium Pan216]
MSLRRMLLVAAVLPLWLSSARADVKMPSIFSDHMVLQRNQPNPVWGKADPGEEVTVTIGDQTKKATAGDDGRWKATLDPLPAGGPHKLSVKGKNAVNIDDVLVGEVWVCSGQSNMRWTVSNSNDADLEIMTSDYPEIRLLNVPNVSTAEPQDDFKGAWQVCGPDTVGPFSGVGYFFGRRLHQALGVPVGLINNAWGGSAAEAWVRHDLLEKDDQYAPMLQRWSKADEWDKKAAEAKYQKQLANWRESAKKAKAAGKKPSAPPRRPRSPYAPNHHPGRLYNGVLHPTIGYGIKGAIWYQGESNASRAYQYRDLFPLMIQNWRDDWGQGEFPFYWVQLADFRGEKAEPDESDWAELREAQTMTAEKLPNTGQAVIVDLGEGKDIHPRDKQGVGNRLARLALARDYGKKVAHQSPTYKSMEKKGNGHVVVTLEHTGGGLKPFDVREVLGFTIAGSDRKFVNANAKVVGPDKVEVWSDQVKDPVAVRYAWADNPICNLYSNQGLPVTPFRTDDWPGVTIDKK